MNPVDDITMNPGLFNYRNTERHFSNGSGGGASSGGVWGGGASGGGASSGGGVSSGGYTKYEPSILESLTFNLGVLLIFVIIVCGFLYYRYKNKQKRLKREKYLIRSGKFYKFLNKIKKNTKKNKINNFKKNIKNSIKKTSKLKAYNNNDTDNYLFL